MPDPPPGLTPDAFAREVIAAHVERELKGKLLAIAARARTAKTPDTELSVSTEQLSLF